MIDFFLFIVWVLAIESISIHPSTTEYVISLSHLPEMFNEELNWNSVVHILWIFSILCSSEHFLFLFNF